MRGVRWRSGGPASELRIFLVAGEPSGDAIGARLMAALRRESSRPVRFLGVGGSRMAAAGLHAPLFPMADLSVMGFGELLPALPRLAYRFQQTLAAARAAGPHAVVGIDSKGFCLRLLGALAADRGDSAARRAPALVQYVAPSAWAFADAPRRAAALRSRVDLLLCLLPFEPALYEAAGVTSAFVGHPAVEQAAEAAAEGGAADKPSKTAICLLPGSRAQEVRATLPPMLEAIDAIDSVVTPPPLLLPTTQSTRAVVEATLAESAAAAAARVALVDSSERHAAYRASRLAIACCGTVNVELALARTPQVAVWRSGAMTTWFIRHLLRPTTPYASLPNILAARHHAAEGEFSPCIPELLFGECAAAPIARTATEMLSRTHAARAHVDVAERAAWALAPRLASSAGESGRAPDWEELVPGAPLAPSTLAAKAVLRAIG